MITFLKDWWRVLELEAPDWRDKAAVLLHMAKVAATSGGLVGWRKRQERIAACAECPIHDPELRRCRRHDESSLGCGCFTPALVWLKRPMPPKAGCWGRQEIGLGWD